MVYFSLDLLRSDLSRSLAFQDYFETNQTAGSGDYTKRQTKIKTGIMLMYVNAHT